MKKYLFTALLIVLAAKTDVVIAQTQTIKGTITDKQSQASIPGVNVIIVGSDPIIGTATDANGHFRITSVNPGRYDLKVTYIGFKEIVIPNVVVTAGKEVSLDVGLEETVNSLEVVVISGTKKNETNNEMTSVSGRSFSVEEVNRYAGGRSDVSRLASNFAGVSTPDDSRNDIVIRGNSPTGVLYRIEGMNIPNPNHFATVGTTGGPVSAINTNVVRNSDFFTSAFPSEYGNANAGVFDLGFRNGNPDKAEQTLQFGALTGLEAMTEGPINKEKGSSYLFAYRYSFTGFAQNLGIPIGTTATPFYQDFSFKINGGNTKAGRFTLFGMGGKSNISFLHNEIDSTDLFADPSKDSYFKSDIGLVGLKHFIRIGENSYFNTVIGSSYSASDFNSDTISSVEPTVVTTVENEAKQIRYSANTSFNSKINSKLFVKVGAIAELINLDLYYRELEDNSTWNQIWNYNDYTSLIQGYAHTKYSFNDKLTMNVGLHSQLLTLNNSLSLEPRVGLKYQVNDKNTFSVGYGMHSQMQPTDVYFYRELQADGSYDQTNQNLDFTRSQHFVMGYDFLPARDWRVKVETYYQLLSDVPVTILPGSFSMLNSGASFNPSDQGHLINNGSGTNYGVELTIEKFFSKGYYGLLTGSLYDSKYKGSDEIERNTGFNGTYVYNLLAGKEIKIGKQNRNTFTVDVKMTQAGGRYYTPVDLEASQAADEQVLNGDDYAFTERNPNYFRLDIKTGITINSKKKKLSQSFFLDIQNVTDYENIFAERYNPVTNTINTAYQIGFFPNFIYKVQF